MKKTTFLIGNFILMALIFSCISGTTFAQQINLSESGSTNLKITDNSYTSLSFENTLSEISFMSVKTRQGNFTHFRVDEYGQSMMIGYPQLPVLKKLIEVPIGASFEIEVLNASFTEVDLSSYNISELVMPAQPPLSKNIDNPEDVEFIMHSDAYQLNDYQGQELINIVELGTMRGVQIARLEVAPISYNAVTNKIKIYYDIDVKVNFVNASVSATIAQKERQFSPFYEGIYSQLANYKPIENKELIMDEPPTSIIVSDPMFESALQPFVEWKAKKGFHVVEAYTDDPAVGTTTNSIKGYLQGFYNNPPNDANPQSFVLFVGDVAQVPAFDGNASWHVTDLYYCTYDGSSDIYPDAYYGRFSANNLTELQPQIDKTLEYEQYLFPDPSFLNEVVMVAGADASHALTWGNGQINYGTNNYFNAAHGLTSHTYLQPEPGGGNYSQLIRQDISNGVAYANYTAHCSNNGWADPSFNMSHISQLSNANKYPLMIGNCCSSVEFANPSSCFGEEILRAANKGALGYIGGSNSTYWDEDFWWGVGFESISANPVYNPNHLGAYDRTFHDNGEPLDEWYVTQGQMPSAGNLAVTQAGSSLEEYYWEIYHLMGDPSVMIYFSEPPVTTANYAGLMPLNTSTFTVNTDAYGYVAISKDGILHGVGMADETGYAEVTMFDPITVPGQADVIITGQNLMPYIGTVTVSSPNGAYVLIDEFEVDDSNGNNNGIVDFSEYVMLDMSLENLGNQTATNLVATISTDDENLTIDNGSHNWPDISSGSTMMENGAFAFTVNDLIDNGHVAGFDLEVTDGTDTWNSAFNVTLHAPVLSIGSYTIDDASGNGNGRLDPGETATLIIPNTNEGGCDALNTMAEMISANPLITVNNASFDLETLAVDETDNALFSITVDASAVVGEVVNVQYNLSSDPYSASSTMALSIGLIVEDFETGNFNAFEWQFDGNADWTVDGTNPYEGSYSAKSGDIGDNQTSALVLTADISTDDQITFFYRVSSESGYDYLKFYIDGQVQGEWAGEVAWTEASFDVTAGTHTFKWEYMKDYSVSSGQDCAWVDYIVFPPFAGMSPLAVVVNASPAEICQGESSQLMAYAMGGNGTYTYDWQPTTGLSDPTIADPIATPDESTTYYVVVDDGSNTVTDQITIVVNEVPDQPVITQTGNMLVSSAVSGNQWYNTSGIIPGATAQNYSPTATDDYYVIVTNSFGCESEPAESYYFIYTGLIEIEEGQQATVYPNPFKDEFTLDYSIQSVTAVQINIYNAFGQLITVIEDAGLKHVGNHRVNFDASDLDTGLYYLRIETNDYTLVKRIIHSK